MKEILAVIKAFEEAHRAGRQCALATVVHVEGSSYRRPGARMLVDDTGQLTGAISGGCLEGDALTKAMLVLSRQKAKLVTYDTTDEDDAKLGVGLGCNGVIQVLIEPIIPADPNNPIELLKGVTSKRQNAALVTLYNLANKNEEQPGTCLLYLQDGVIAVKQDADYPHKTLLEDAKAALLCNASSFKNYTLGLQNITAFIEFIPPPISLVVIGAGNDVVPLISMAETLGWQTTVIDGRHTHAKPERFSGSCQVVVSKPEKALEQFTIDGQTAIVLMTHNYNYDLAMLRALSQANAPYIGSLGPKKKLNRMLEQLREEGLVVTESLLSTLHGPTGLDIGAETPEEIALSVLAEIKAVFSKRPSGQLRNNIDVIHARKQAVIQQVHLQ